MIYLVTALTTVGILNLSMCTYAVGMYFSDNTVLSLALGTLGSFCLTGLSLVIELEQKKVTNATSSN